MMRTIGKKSSYSHSKISRKRRVAMSSFDCKIAKFGNPKCSTSRDPKLVVNTTNARFSLGKRTGKNSHLEFQHHNQI